MRGFLIIIVALFCVKQINAKNVTCKGVLHGELIPNPKDCNKFYQCVGYKPVQLNCPVGLHFNRLLHVCDWPQNAKCTVELNNTTTTIVYPNSTTTEPTTINSNSTIINSTTINPNSTTTEPTTMHLNFTTTISSNTTAVNDALLTESGTTVDSMLSVKPTQLPTTTTTD